METTQPGNRLQTIGSRMKSLVRNTILLLILAGGSFLFVKYYSYIFARTVEGVIDSVEKISPNLALVGGGVSPATSRELFSFAVGIKTKDGEIVTGSSEDRQWMVAKPGLCAEARFFPYPPWQVDKAGTYFGARLLKLYDCDKKTATPQKSNRNGL